MNNDLIKRNWKQIRGMAYQWWGKLTDDDLDVIQGKYNVLVAKLQERYGYSKENAAQEVNRRLRELEESVRQQNQQSSES